MDEEKRLDETEKEDSGASLGTSTKETVIEVSTETAEQVYEAAVDENEISDTPVIEIEEENENSAEEDEAYGENVFADEEQTLVIEEHEDDGYTQPDTDIFSGYDVTRSEENVKYSALPKSKNGFLKFLGIIAAIAVVVMLMIIATSSFFAPKSSYEVGEPVVTNVPTVGASEKPSQLVPEEHDKNRTMPEFGGELPEIMNLYNPVIEIAEQESPAVVSVMIDRTTTGEDGTELITGWVKGSGFIVSKDGYIITNYHVVEEGGTIKVRLLDESEYIAKYIGGDATIDIALLKIEGEDLPIVAIGKSSETKQGELAIAIGNPAGMDDELPNSVTVGYVSAVNREIQFNGYQQQFLQIDTPINSGNSGGPVFDSKGAVIGIVTLKSLISSYDDEGNPIDSEGLGFAIPIDLALDAIEEIFDHGSVRRPGIGIYYRFYDKNAAALSEKDPGMHIEEVVAGGPADKVGVKVGDIITHCNGIEITTGREVSEAIANRKIGDTIVLTVERDGQIIDFTVTIADLNSIQE